MDRIFGRPITKAERSRIMSRIRSKDTSLETKIRSLLFHEGFRYRIHYNVPGKPDIAFPNKKLAVFINGCFWHGHGCYNSRSPKNNADFWNKKLTTNRERDKRNNSQLKNLGWKVLTLWECEIESDVNNSVAYIGRQYISIEH